MYFVKIKKEEFQEFEELVIDEFFKQLDEAEEYIGIPEVVFTEPTDLVDDIDVIIKSIFNNKYVVTWEYERSVSWDTEGAIIEVLEDGVEISWGKYFEAFLEDAEKEWAEYCKPIWPEHPFIDGKFDEHPLKFHDPYYRGKFPEWDKVLKSKNA